MELSIDWEKVVEGLEHLAELLFQQYQVVYDGDAPTYYDAYKTVDDAIAMLKEQGEQIKRLEHDLAVTQNNLNYYMNGND